MKRMVMTLGCDSIQSRRVRFASWLCAAAGALAIACGAEADGLQEDDEATTVGQGRQGLAALPEVFSLTKLNGFDSINLRSSITHYCYLTKVQGHFEGGGERVGVFPSGDVWRLRIDSARTQAGSDITAGASCVPLTYDGRTRPLSDQKNWSQGASPIRLADDDGATVCHLNRVAGHFEGSGELVEVVRANGAWWLQGHSAQSGVSAGARCIRESFFIGTRDHSSNCWRLPAEQSVTCHPEESVAFASDTFGSGKIGCGLGRMSGKFKGGAEIVQVENAGGQWRIQARGRQSSWYDTSAHCFF